jgi:hypothetical protein
VEALEIEFLAFLTGTPDGGLYVVTQNASGSSITKWLRTLIEIKITHEESRRKLLLLCQRIDDTRGERNVVVHGLWHPGKEPEAGLVQTINLAREEAVVSHFMTRPDLNDLAHRIGEIIAELIHVGGNMGWHKKIVR